MNYLHYQFSAGPGDIIEVTLDTQANVLLLDSTDYSRYRRGEGFRYYGGLAKTSPVRLSPTHHGTWHVCIDLGGYSGTVKAAARLIHN